MAYFLDEVVEQLNLSAIYAEYQESRGQPPYDPRMMVKVWLYAYSRGIRSTRKVERAVQEGIGFGCLAGGQEPKFWALNHFRTRHRKALAEVVRPDGSPGRAGRVGEEDERFGRNRRGEELPEHLRTQEQRLEVFRRAMAELEAEAEAEGREFHPRKDPGEAKPAPKVQHNFADPESRIMKSSNDGFVQAYNAQVLVDAGSQIVVATDLTAEPVDTPHLPRLLSQAGANIVRRPRQVSADAGYWSEANLNAIEAMGAEAFVPPDRVKHSEWRAAKPPKGRIPKDITPANLMLREMYTAGVAFGYGA